MRPAQQGLVLCGAIVFWYEDRGAPFAFHLAPDIAHEAIDGDGKAPFVEPLDHNVALVGFHCDRIPRRPGRCPLMAVKPAKGTRNKRAPPLPARRPAFSASDYVSGSRSMRAAP